MKSRLLTDKHRNRTKTWLLLQRSKKIIKNNTEEKILQNLDVCTQCRRSGAKLTRRLNVPTCVWQYNGVSDELLGVLGLPVADLGFSFAHIGSPVFNQIIKDVCDHLHYVRTFHDCFSLRQRKVKYSENKLKTLKARNEYLLTLEATNASVFKYYIHDLPDIIDVSMHSSHLSNTSFSEFTHRNEVWTQVCSGKTGCGVSSERAIEQRRVVEIRRVPDA